MPVAIIIVSDTKAGCGGGRGGNRSATSVAGRLPQVRPHPTSCWPLHLGESPLSEKLSPAHQGRCWYQLSLQPGLR